MAGLNLYETQQAILDHMKDELSQQVYAGFVDDASTLFEQNGDLHPIVVVQFNDMMPSGRGKMFCGPRSDEYYSNMRILVVGDSTMEVLAVASRVNEVLLGWEGPNMTPISKDLGGGSYTTPQVNAKPSQAGVYMNFRFYTNMEDVGVFN